MRVAPIHTHRSHDIDALRGIAAIGVMMYHYTSLYPRVAGIPTPIYACSHGHYGVELFFLISGYVIYMSTERGIDWRSFLLLRAARLLPAYWVSMGVCVIACYGVPFLPIPLSNMELLANTTMIPKIFSPHIPYLQEVYWTLSAEWMFYIYIAIAIGTGLLWRIEILIWVMLITTFAASYLPHESPIYTYLYNNLLAYNNLPLFGIGICLYRIRTQPVEWITLLLCYGVYACQHEIQYNIVVAGCIALYYGVVHLHLVLPSISKVLSYLGLISYSIYLLHQLLGYAAIYHLMQWGLSYPLSLCVTILLVLGLSVLSYWLIERRGYDYLRNRVYRQ